MIRLLAAVNLLLAGQAHAPSHAGQAREWLLNDCVPGQPIPEPDRVTLNKDQVLHHFKDHDPHSLDGVEIVVVGSAGDGLGFFEGY